MQSQATESDGGWELAGFAGGAQRQL